MHILFSTFFFFLKKKIKLRTLITKTLKVAAKGVNLRVLTLTHQWFSAYAYT